MEFGDGKGQLFEGRAPSDFRRSFSARIEWKDSDDGGLGPLEDVLDEIGAATTYESMMEVAEARFDMPAAIKFMAIAELIRLNDSYCTNFNNWYAYMDPDNGDRLTLIPWGFDQGLRVANKNQVL